jgi:hypothetical protein
MKASLRMWVGRISVVMTTVVATAPQPVGATPIASLQYLETELGGGQFRYEYTLFNVADPGEDPGADAYDFALFFSPSTSLVSSNTPAGWALIGGDGFLDTFSTRPGAAPLGTDVGPGQSLAGFDFVFDGQLGSIPFQVVFANPVDPGNPHVYDGLTVAAPAAVPEPGSLLLLGSGVVTMALARRRRRA